MKEIVVNFTLNVFLVLVFFLAFLPSGTIAYIPVKSITMTFLVIALIVTALINNEIKIPLNVLKEFVFFMIVMLSYILLSLFNGFEVNSVLIEAKFVISFFVVFFIGKLFLYHYPSKVMAKTTFKFAFWGSFMFVLSKSTIVISLLLGIIDYPFVRDVIFPFIKYKPVVMSIAAGGSRFSFVTLDFLSTYIIFFYLILKRKVNFSKFFNYAFYAYTVFYMISFYSAYSRGLFLVLMILLFMYSVVYKKYRMLIGFIVVSALIAISFWDLIEIIIRQRFIHQEHSDSHRVDMYVNLIRFWSESPVLGWGIGAYVPSYIRSNVYRFTYEMQLLSYVMKMGFVFITFFIYVNFLFIKAFFKKQNKNVLFIYLMFLLWMVMDMTNQYLFNTTVAVIALLSYYIIQFYNLDGA